MFGSDKNASRRPASAAVETLIGARVTVRGDLHFSGGLYVDGIIHGGVIAEEGQSEAILTVSEKGVIHGEVRAPHIVLNGQLHGDVHAGERIELGPTARVEGDIHYKVVEMAAGAMVTGRLIHVDASMPKQLAKPERTAPTGIVDEKKAVA